MPDTNVTLLCQLLRLIPRNLVSIQVERHDTDKHAKGFDTWTHLVSMLMCHLGNLGSLRDISHGLRSATGNLNHLGIDHAPAHSTISYQNQHRSWEVFRDIYMTLLERLEPSMAKRRLEAMRLKRKIFILDSSIVALALSLFNWAIYRQTKGGIKLHTVLDYDNGLPVYLNVTDAKTHDSKGAPDLKIPSGSVLVIDRAYVDFGWLAILDSLGVFFVTRIKRNVLFEVVDSKYNEHYEAYEADETIQLTGKAASQKYAKQLRLVTVWDDKNQQWLHLLTNNHTWADTTISGLYRARWDVEVFFKTIKQALRIKSFVGTSKNAVMIQIWTAMIAILLIKYLKAKAKHEWHLSNLVGMLRLNLFVKIDLWKWVNNPIFVIKNRILDQPNLFSG